MKKKLPSQEHLDKVSHGIHRSTITMTLVLLVFGAVILPSSSPSSPAFVPLILSMMISGATFIWASLSLKKQVRKEMQRKAEMGPFAHMMNSDIQKEEL